MAARTEVIGHIVSVVRKQRINGELGRAYKTSRLGPPSLSTKFDDPSLVL